MFIQHFFKKFFLSIFLLFFLVLGNTLHAKNNTQQKIQPEEEDLFRKDIAAVILNGEFLYWTVSEGALDYALVMKQPSWGPDNVYANGSYKKASYDWDPGFRVGIGYYNAPKYWEVKGEYARMVIDGSDSVNAPSEANRFLTGTFPQIISAPLTSANSHIKMKYNLADLVVDRIFIPNPHLRIKVAGGLTFAHIKQNWVVNYFNSQSQNTKTRNRWKFWGPGFRLGILFDWFWGKDFYLTGRSTFAFLVGRYKNLSWAKTNYEPSASYNSDIAFKDAEYKHNKPAFTGQFLLGPSWQKSFTCARVEIFAGYEFTGWFNLHEIYRSSSGIANIEKETFINRELLAMHGLTTRLTVDF